MIIPSISLSYRPKPWSHRLP